MPPFAEPWLDNLAQRLRVDQQTLAPWTSLLVFVFALLAFHLIFSGAFPAADERIGSEYRFVLPQLLDGFLWVREQGLLSIQWFTPSFCGGQAVFADPQSFSASLPQLLAIALDPLSAVYLTVLFMAATGYWGMYLLVRRAFGLSRLASALAATLFMFNGFFTARMIGGQLGAHGIMLLPWAVYWLTAVRDRRGVIARWSRPELLRILLAALTLAYWIHSGLSTIILPSILALLGLVAVIDLLTPGTLATALRRGLVAVFVALAISSAKLLASYDLIHSLPKAYHPHFGFDSLGDALQMILIALFGFTEHAAALLQSLSRDHGTVTQPFEAAFGVTLIPAILVLALGIDRLYAWLRSKDERSKAKIQPMTVLMLLFMVGGLVAQTTTADFGGYGLLLSLLLLAILVLLILKDSDSVWNYRRIPLPPFLILVLTLLFPLASLLDGRNWNDLLALLPSGGLEPSVTRWLTMLLPLPILGAAVLADHLSVRRTAIILCLLAVPFFSAFTDRAPSPDTARFDPANVITFAEEVRAGNATPGITHLIDIGPLPQTGVTLDALTTGGSPLRCQNPLYGHEMTRFQVRPLRGGPITQETDSGYLNLRNPACLTAPRENGCRTWDAFKAADRDAMESFARYKSYDFDLPKTQIAAGYLSVLSLLAALGLLVTLGTSASRAWIAERGNSSRPLSNPSSQSTDGSASEKPS